MKLFIVRLIAYCFSWFKYRQFIKETKEFRHQQENTWSDIYQTICHSEFWKNNLRPNIKDNPITEYTDYEAILNKNKSYFHSLLNNEQIIFWIRSGGTTGSEKLFPMTESFKKSYQKTLYPFAHSLYRRFSKLGHRPILYFVATKDLCQKLENHLEVGFMSTYNFDNLPKLLKAQYQFPNHLFDNSDYFSKNYPYYALASDLSAIFSVTPLSLSRLFDRVNSDWEMLLNNFKANKAPIKISAKRLSYLQSLDRNHLSFKLIWPGLETVVCWQSSLCSQQMQSIEQYMNQVAKTDAIYSATEAWINCPTLNELGGPIHPSSGYFEFIELGKEIVVSNIINSWELEVGKKYELLITNVMGLVRYRIKDVVLCTGHFNQSPKIVFDSKADRTVSLGILTLAESELVDALISLNIPDTKNWRFSPGKHANQIVLYTDRIIANELEVQELLEEFLLKSNVNYKSFRSNNTVKPILVKFLDKGKRFWEHKIEHAQTKPTYLISKWIE